MKFQFALSMVILMLATTTQGLSLGGSRTSNLNQQTSLSADITPTVTLYQYPPQYQVIHRTIRPVVRRTIYVPEPSPSSTDIERVLPDLIRSIIPSELSEAIGGITSGLGRILTPSSPAPVVFSAPVRASAPINQGYYLY
ncbi:uncharacterized protein LOC129947353 [Eupeodes corollae]|uniref:uncharacterized protein LOC129947353 n=1 Tax=Eupeodes corollae TaxID=290404 RepID=UPI00249369A4|nr:uncharacterized protein LOC129947353 [Eupeodes corollae]